MCEAASKLIQYLYSCGGEGKFAPLYKLQSVRRRRGMKKEARRSSSCCPRGATSAHRGSTTVMSAAPLHLLQEEQRPLISQNALCLFSRSLLMVVKVPSCTTSELNNACATGRNSSFPHTHNYRINKASAEGKKLPERTFRKGYWWRTLRMHTEVTVLKKNNSDDKEWTE